METLRGTATTTKTTMTTEMATLRGTASTTIGNRMATTTTTIMETATATLRGTTTTTTTMTLRSVPAIVPIKYRIIVLLLATATAVDPIPMILMAMMETPFLST